MVRIPLLMAPVLRRSRAAGLPLDRADTGYVVHGALAGALGELAPRPFVVQESSRHVSIVLGYSRATAQELQARAQSFGDPECYSCIEWDRVADKPMPAIWTPGQRIGFEVRCCPVIRVGRNATGFTAGAEVDVFVAACAKVGREIDVDRAEIYRRWFSQRVGDGEGVTVEAVAVEGFRRARLFRQTQGQDRRSRVLERPDATLRGVLRVLKVDAFQGVLARGIGRHRAFGFGMLLLRPVA